MINIYTFLFVFNLRYFQQIMRTLEYIQGIHPDSVNSSSVAWSY